MPLSGLSALDFNSEVMNQIAAWFMYSCVIFFFFFLLRQIKSMSDLALVFV